MLKMQGPDRFVSRLSVRVLFAENNPNRWGNVSPLDKQQVHLLHATKAAESPSLVFLSRNTIPQCAAPSGHSYHPVGFGGNEETIQAC